MKHAALLALPFLLLPATASAQPNPADHPPEQCFWARNVTGFAPVRGRRDTLRITVNLRDVYELDVLGCPNADLANRVALVARGASNRICNAIDAELVVPSPGIGPQRCQVSAIRRITPEQLAAEKAARNVRRR